jgi:hypothetical protein
VAEPIRYSEDNPRRHTAKLKALLTEVAEHVRQDVLKVNDARAQALFETTAEVVGGLKAACEHYEARSEPAWRQEGAERKAPASRG